MINNEEIIVNVLEEDIIHVKGDEEIFEVGTQIIPVTAENDPIFIQSPAYGIASTDITNWNGKSDFSGNYNDLTDKPTIPTELADLTDDSTHRVVTDTEKSTWNNKSDFSGNYNDLSNKPTIPTKTSDITNDSGFITIEATERNILRARLTSDFNIVSNNYTEINTWEEYLKTGNKLSISNGKIRIGSGVSKIKVSASLGIYINNSTGDSIYIYTKKNGTDNGVWVVNNYNSSGFFRVSYEDVLLVNENDLISMSIYGSDSGTQLQALMNSFIVEVIE